MKKQILTTVLCIAALVPVRAQLTEPEYTAGPQTDRTGTSGYIQMTLEDCLFYAMRNSYNRQSMILSEESAEVAFDQSKLERLPSLDATLSESLNHTRGNSAVWSGNYGLSTGVTLYQGNSVANTIEQNRLLMEQSGYQTDQYDNELTIQILQSFLSVLGNEELLKYQRAVVRASEEQRAQGEELYRAGAMIESDYLLLEAQYASDLDNIVESTISRDNNLLTLKVLMSMDPSVPIEIIYPDTTTIIEMMVLPDEYYVMERAWESLPDLEISRYSVDIAALSVDIARSSLYPTVSMSGSIGTGHNPNFRNYGEQLNNRLNESVGLSVNIPIFNRGRTKSNIARNRIALQQAELSNLQTELNIRQTVIQEYRNVVSSLSKYRSTVVKEDAYRKSFEAYRAMFNAGAITTVDLLQQQNNYINALYDYIQSKYGFMLRRKILDVYMGEEIRM